MTQCSSCGGFCGRVCQREFADRALNSALYWQNRYCDLLEIIELFCMDAEHERWAPTAETKEQMHKAEFELGKWLSAALDDESNCAEFKKAIIDWMTFSPLENNP